MNGGAAELTVVVVSYNSARWLPHCLSSLREACFQPPRRVVVVDNASSDGSADLVRHRFPWAVLLANTVNVGYSRAVNQASRRFGGRYLLVLNPDVVAESRSLQVLHRYLEENPDVALVAPRLLHPDRSLQYSRRLSVKPGITCLWQVGGRNRVDFDEWMRLDLLYIDSWSLWLHLKILLRTIPAVLTGRGAS